MFAFLSKVREGSYRGTGHWCQDLICAKGKELNIGNWYLRYMACSKCAKKYGKNQVATIW